MKQKLGKAMWLMLAVTMEDIGFFVISGIALAIILKLGAWYNKVMIPQTLHQQYRKST